MKFVIFLLTLMMVSYAYPVSLYIINNTGGNIRIDKFNNKCSGPAIKAPMPVIIYTGASLGLKLTQVIHTYEICGSGYCVSSALGFDSDGVYSLEVYLQGDGKINTKQKPDEWPGKMECPK